MRHMAHPLSQLRDIHTPEPISWWPLAPGWYLLAVILFTILIWSGLKTVYRFKQRKIARLGFKKLEHFKRQYEKGLVTSPEAAAHISKLLKQVAIYYYPRLEVASLAGQDWLLFLEKTSKKTNFRLIADDLLKVPYQPTSEKDLTDLFSMASLWVKQQGKRHV